MLTGLLLLVTSKLLLLFLSTWKRRCFKTNNRALAAVRLCPYPAISTRLFQQCRQNCTRYSSRFHCAVQCSTCTAVECSAVQFSVQYSAPESYSLERGYSRDFSKVFQKPLDSVPVRPAPVRSLSRPLGPGDIWYVRILLLCFCGSTCWANHFSSGTGRVVGGFTDDVFCVFCDYLFTSKNITPTKNKLTKKTWAEGKNGPTRKMSQKSQRCCYAL